MKKSIILCGLLSLGMAFVAPVKAICVGVERYQISGGGFIYLLRDFHSNSESVASKEQCDFIRHAQSKNAYCIIEDMLQYGGDNKLVQKCIDAWNVQLGDSYAKAKGADELNFVKDNYTGLSRLHRLCQDQGVNCFNAECRQPGIAFKGGVYKY